MPIANLPKPCDNAKYCVSQCFAASSVRVGRLAQASHAPLLCDTPRGAKCRLPTCQNRAGGNAKAWASEEPAA
eukprot:7057475-Alexandrium_andersonii.AAC.1